MGEYAQNQKGEEVKLGVCEDYFYIRYEDRNKVFPNVAESGLRWRLPYPDEDFFGVGKYKDHDRAYLLRGYIPNDLEETDAWLYFNTYYSLGMQLAVKCHHGNPEAKGEKTENINLHISHHHHPEWFELSAVKNHKEEDGSIKLYPIIRCRACKSLWSVSWDDVLPFVLDTSLRKRLEDYKSY